MSQWNLGSTSVSQVVRVPALGLDRVIHGVEVCCCGGEQVHADGSMKDVGGGLGRLGLPPSPLPAAGAPPLRQIRLIGRSR